MRRSYSATAASISLRSASKTLLLYVRFVIIQERESRLVFEGMIIPSAHATARIVCTPRQNLDVKISSYVPGRATRTRLKVTRQLTSGELHHVANQRIGRMQRNRARRVTGIAVMRQPVD